MLKLTSHATGVTFYVRASAINKIMPINGGCVLHTANDQIYVMESAAEVLEMMK